MRGAGTHLQALVARSTELIGKHHPLRAGSANDAAAHESCHDVICYQSLLQLRLWLCCLIRLPHGSISDGGAGGGGGHWGLRGVACRLLARERWHGFCCVRRALFDKELDEFLPRDDRELVAIEIATSDHVGKGARAACGEEDAMRA